MNNTFRDFEDLRKKNTNVKDVFLNQYQDWPPSPLRSNDFNNVKFQISDEKARIYIVHRLISAFKTRVALIQRLPCLLRSQLSDEIDEIDSQSLLLKVVAFFLCLLLLPVLILFSFFQPLPNRRSEFETAGFVMPGIKGHIYMNKNLDFEVLSILGHECVHLLQNNAEGNIDLKIENDALIQYQKESGFFIGSDENRGFQEYLFGRMEIEARFHECMVFYYEHQKLLPVTKLDFLSALFSFKFSQNLIDILKQCPESSEPSELLNKIILNSEKNKTPVGEIEVYSNLSSEMGYLLASFSNVVFVLTEYFPNCYERLLILYGDTGNSLKFKRSQI